jgi:hypothetical protein
MNKSLFRAVAGIILLFSAVSFPVSGLAADQPGQAHPLLSVGNPGPKAVDLTVTTARSEADASGKQAPPVIHLEAPAKAYVTAVYVASNGDVILVFPNKESPDNLLVSGKQYTLFGPDSRVQLKKSKVVKDAKIVFFVSSKPFLLDQLNMPPGEVFLTIPHSSVPEQKALLNKIEEMSKDEGFNRKVIDLESAMKPIIRLDVMGIDEKIKSRKPGTLAGSQGVQGEAEGSKKE